MPASLDQNRFQLENYSLVSGRQSSSVSNGIRLSRFVQPQEIWDEMFGVSVDGVQGQKRRSGIRPFISCNVILELRNRIVA
ncbi:hypothetical protein CDAR_616671 [Caerostris darwini]|uniref:Uncharacterized protein n=1 Tax=Caerostris darwini TaxID=1538125 RepID=A0AAV4VSZ2_9ARAC|nr:hypothetical protein CDAR_616671 [Caerostris darwini]